MTSLRAAVFEPTPNRFLLHFRRFEFKYLITLDQYYQIKPLISARAVLDPFTHNAGSYLIESLYYDTPALRFYQDTRDGVKQRVKYRLRRYATGYSRRPYVFWEIKRKNDLTVIKDRALLTLSQSTALLGNSRPPHPLPKVINDFLFARQRYLLQPKVLVRYRREPYLAAGIDLRITFDRFIQVNTQHSLVCPLAGKSVLNDLVVFELKFTGSLPFWLGDLLRRYDLERVAFSKYSLAVETAKFYLPWIIS